MSTDEPQAAASDARDALRPEAVWAAARERYWHNAEFHYRVERAVNIAGQAGYDTQDRGSRAMLCHAMALVLQVEDTAQANDGEKGIDRA